MNIQRYKKVEFNLFKSLSMKKEKLNLWYTNGLNYRINFSNQKIKYIILSIFSILLSLNNLSIFL